MENQDKVERVPVGYVGSEDWPRFVSALLDQYEEANHLSWQDEAIPQNDIIIKVVVVVVGGGGDYGGDSFKFMLQVGNVKTPNHYYYYLLIFLLTVISRDSLLVRAPDS